MGNTGTSTTKNSDSRRSLKKKKQKKKKNKHKKSKSPPPSKEKRNNPIDTMIPTDNSPPPAHPKLKHTGASQSQNDLHLQEQSKLSHPDTIRESQSAPSPDTTPQPQWSSMSDQYIIEQIRDLCADNKISVINIDTIARQYLFDAMRASPADKERINHIITELCRQEGYGHQLSIVDETETSDAKESNELSFDELTPSTYIKKQNELTVTEEYLNLQSQYWVSMQPLLKKHTRKTLLEQCANHNCPGILNMKQSANGQSRNVKEIARVLFKYCQSVQRIDCLLSLYHKLMKSKTLWRNVAMGPLLRCHGDIYTHQQIFNDFLHIKMHHIDRDKQLAIANANDQNIATILHDKFCTLYECDGIKDGLPSCAAFRRHYRDRADRGAEREMFHLIENEDNMKSLKIRNEKEWVLQEECDKIHSYFLHSTIEFPNTDVETRTKQTEHVYTNTNHEILVSAAIEEKSNQKVDQIAESASGRSFSAMVLLRDDQRNASLAVTKSNSDRTHLTIEQKQALASPKPLGAVSSNSSHVTANPSKTPDDVASSTSDTEEALDEKNKTSDQEGKGYVGQREDQRWLDEMDKINKDRKATDEKTTDEEVYRLLVENMGVFRWQSAHGFRTGQNRGLAHLKPKWKNVKEEALNNSYSKASIDNWNSTLRKSKIFYQSFGRRRIKTLYNGVFIDEVTNITANWQQGQSITLTEIVILKLYTDFDKLQHELKKCFRWETIAFVLAKHEETESDTNDMIRDKDAQMKADLENRLREFFHWRVGLLQVLNKYGQKIDQHTMVLYHGVNAKMILNPAETMAFYGPLSTTSSYHVAKTFATAKGMVLKITSQYPRLDFCRAFDASLISDYPEEQEYLIGFLYMRVLEVRTRPITTNIMDPELWKKAPLASKMRVVFFAIHLFGEQMFSMSGHLEYYLVEFLKCLRKDCCSRKTELTPTQRESFLSFLCCRIAKHDKSLTRESDWKKLKPDKERQKEEQILRILWNKFESFRLKPNFKRAIKIDMISESLKQFLLKKDKNDNKDIAGKYKYRVSFTNLLQIFENLEEVHYINSYRFDDDVLRELITTLIKQNTESALWRSSQPFLPQSNSSDTPDPIANTTAKRSHATHSNYSVDVTDKIHDRIRNNIKPKDSKHFLNKIVFVYYDYEDKKDNKNEPLGYPEDGDKFFHPKGLDPTCVETLKDLGWTIKHGKNGRIGYKIRIQKKSRHETRQSFANFKKDSVRLLPLK
eukprot:189073_1